MRKGQRLWVERQRVQCERALRWLLCLVFLFPHLTNASGLFRLLFGCALCRHLDIFPSRY
jgi:hypothetical protein